MSGTDRPDRQGAAHLLILVWLIFGGLIGTAVGYVVYVRQTPLFESTALIAVLQSDREREADASHDESVRLIGEPTIERAVREHQLDRLPELKPTSKGESAVKETTRSLARSERLEATKVSQTTDGPVYQISYRGTSPLATRQVVDAVVDAAGQSTPALGNRDLWTKSLELLSQSRKDVNARITELQDALDSIEATDQATIRGTELISSSAVRWEQLRAEIDQEHERYGRLRDRLQIVEELRSRDAPAKAILKALREPIRVKVRMVKLEETPVSIKIEKATVPIDQTSERARQFAKEAAPLEREMERLLKRFGPSHPTIIGVRQRIDDLKLKYGMQDGEVASTSQPAEETRQQAAQESAEDGTEGVADDRIEKEQLAEIEQLSNQLQKSIQQSEQRVDELLSQLNDAAVSMAKQERTLRRAKSLRKELERQQAFEAEILTRLNALPDQPPFAERAIEVLRSAGDGVQVAPKIQPYVAGGAGLGALLGLALGLMLALAASLGEAELAETELTGPGRVEPGRAGSKHVPSEVVQSGGTSSPVSVSMPEQSTGLPAGSA
jgi:hypothetical protein